MKHPASAATVKFSTNDFKITAIVDKLPKEIRGGIVKIAGFANGIIHRVATLNKEFTLPEPDQPRSATIYLSTRNLDSDMDIVMPTGWDKSMYRGQGLWAHQHSSDPIYKALDTQSDDYGLWQVIQFAETERGENYWSMVKGGFLQTFSAGMWVKPEGSVVRGETRFKSIMDLCKDWPEFTKAQQDQVARFIVNKYLIESTLCNVPANPFAMVMAVNKGELSLSDGVKKELNFEGLVKKFMDAGELEGKTICTVNKGDLPGHEFRGNQYTGGGGGGESDEFNSKKGEATESSANEFLSQNPSIEEKLTSRVLAMSKAEASTGVSDAIWYRINAEAADIVKDEVSAGRVEQGSHSQVLFDRLVARMDVRTPDLKRQWTARQAISSSKSHPAVRIVPTVKVVSGVPLEQIVEKYVEKKIARLRGKI